MTARQKLWQVTLALGFISVIAGALFVVMLQQWLAGRQAESWRPAEGEVSIVDESGGKQSSIEVRYSYRYGGNVYEGRKKSFGFMGGGQERRALSLANGQKVQVWVNPNDPSEAVLFPGVSLPTKVFVVLTGLAMTGVGLLGFAVAIFYRIKGPRFVFGHAP